MIFPTAFRQLLRTALLISALVAPNANAQDAEEPKTEHVLEAEQRKIPALEKWEGLRILYYKPIYFAYGNSNTKLQMSFRSPLSENIPFNFAYSQIIFWNLQAESKPFLDATYNPEFFYRYKVKNSSLQTIDFGVFEHNSNGKAGEASRSYNQSYARFNFATEGKRWITQFSLKLKYLYDFDDTNADIRDYVSPVEFQFRFLQLYDSFFDESEVSLSIMPGGKFAERWDRGGYQIGIASRPGRIKIIPAIYVQYYQGYTETLINYTQPVHQLRVGLLF